MMRRPLRGALRREQGRPIDIFHRSRGGTEQADTRLIHRMRGDVVGLGGEQQADEERGNEGQARSHVTLPALGGVGAGSGVGRG